MTADRANSIVAPSAHFILSFSLFCSTCSYISRPVPLTSDLVGSSTFHHVDAPGLMKKLENLFLIFKIICGTRLYKDDILRGQYITTFSVIFFFLQKPVSGYIEVW